MKYTLYRRMSIDEADKTLASKQFFKPDQQIYLPRKWFSTSLLRTHYFKNPFYNGESVIVKVEVNEDYYRKIFEEGIFIEKEPNGFYGYDESNCDILYAKAHKTIHDLYNVGIYDLDTFNKQFSDVCVIAEDAYCDFIASLFLGESLKNMVQFQSVETPLDFYVQVAYDVAVLSLKYQTIMPEGINPILKKMHFSKDLEELKRKNLHKFKATLHVRFRREILCYSRFREIQMSMDSQEVITFAPFVERVSLIELLPSQEEYKQFLQIAGDNLYTKHEAKEFPAYSRLSFQDFNQVTFLLFQKDFSLDMLLRYLPNLKDLENVQQVDPRHIDNVKTHIEKSIRFSNLVVNYFKNQGMQLDATTLVYLKWVLLLHDLGKPYCACCNITTRYSQFKDKEQYADSITFQVLDDDIAFPVSQIMKLFRVSSLCQNKKIRNFLSLLLRDIQAYYHVSREEAFSYLNSYIQVALLAKVSHTASLKTRSFCSSYVDDLQFFDRVQEELLAFQDNGFVFPYEEYFHDAMGAYQTIVEDYYVEKDKSILDSVYSIRQSDYQDLSLVYKSKMEHVHLLDDEEMYCCDTLISQFSFEDPLVFAYFSEKLGTDNSHGILHEQKVMVFSFLLGRLCHLCDEDMEILLLASKYHDRGRIFSKELDHGAKSVLLLQNEDTLSAYTNREYVYALIEGHAYPDSSDDAILAKYSVDTKRAKYLLSLFKDADALDRVRFDSYEKYGSLLHIRYLRTEEARRLVKFAYLYNAAIRENKKELAPSIKCLLKK